MFNHNISRQIAVDRAMNAVGVGTGDTQNGSVIDTLGYESLVFAVHFGTLTNTAVTTIKVQAGNNSNGSDMADITGASVSVPDTGSNKIFFSPEIHRPTKRYARVTVTRATANAIIASGIALLGRGGFLPPAAAANQGNTSPVVIVSP